MSVDLGFCVDEFHSRDGSAVVGRMTSATVMERRFRQVVEASPNAIILTDPTGRIEMVNSQTEIIFGFPRDEMLGQPIGILVPARFHGRHAGLLAEFSANPVSRPTAASVELFGVRKDGSEFPVEIRLNPIETDDGVLVLSVVADVSDWKRREEATQAALREKEALLGEIHHRVKNNLQIVCSLLDLQSARVKDAAVSAALKSSQNRVRSMALIHQTLYQSLDFTQVDFDSFLRSLCPNLVATYGVDASRISLRIEGTALMLPINAAIPCGLIMNELISNALKHAFPVLRQGEIKITLERLEQGLARIEVRDNGVGLPPDFDIDKATTLGLQLVTLLTGQLGGELTVHPRDPTSFRLAFPLVKSP